MQGVRCDAVRALLASGNAAERRLWKSEITIIYWGLLSQLANNMAIFLNDKKLAAKMGMKGKIRLNNIFTFNTFI